MSLKREVVRMKKITTTPIIKIIKMKIQMEILSRHLG